MRHALESGHKRIAAAMIDCGVKQENAQDGQSPQSIETFYALFVHGMDRAFGHRNQPPDCTVIAATKRGWWANRIALALIVVCQQFAAGKHSSTPAVDESANARPGAT